MKIRFDDGTSSYSLGPRATGNRAPLPEREIRRVIARWLSAEPWRTQLRTYAAREFRVEARTDDALLDRICAVLSARGLSLCRIEPVTLGDASLLEEFEPEVKPLPTPPRKGDAPEPCALSITSETELTFPTDQRRTRIAVTERVTLRASEATGDVTWSMAAGRGTLSTQAGVTFIADDLAGNATIMAEDGHGCQATIEFYVVCNYLITTTRMHAIFTRASDERIKDLTRAFNEFHERFFVNTCLRQAHFFAQVLTEIGADGEPIHENLNYTPERLIQKFAYYQQHPEEAERDGRTANHAADQQTIANKAYANRLGNGDIASGDGFRFRGRGFIQLTGRENYQGIQREITARFPGSGVDVAAIPDAATTIRGGMISAMAFWSRRNLHELADGGATDADVDNISERVNVHQRLRGKKRRRNNFHTTQSVFRVADCPRPHG